MSTVDHVYFDRGPKSLATVNQEGLLKRRLPLLAKNLLTSGQEHAHFGQEHAQLGQEHAQFGQEYAQFGLDSALFGLDSALFGLDSAHFWAAFGPGSGLLGPCIQASGTHNPGLWTLQHRRYGLWGPE